VKVWIIEILKGEKIKFAQKVFEFFHNHQFWFFNIYLSLVLKLSNIEKNTKFPNSQFMKMSYSYFIFSFENYSSLFQILNFSDEILRSWYMGDFV
jgi:hypothetical protein